MRVLVLGAGVVGTATSWYLAEAGHEVIVLDRCEGPGMETSFANGGQISPCHAEPWANPRVLPRALKWLGHEDAPLLFRWNRWDPALWAWGLRFMANCTGGRAEINTERTLRIALYSRSRLQELRTATGLDYDYKGLGILHIYRDSREFEHAQGTAGIMRRLGLDRQAKTVQECVAIEPALAAISTQLAGGILTPEDESGDAHQFTAGLAALAQAKGVVFRTGTTIRAILKEGDQVAGIVTDSDTITADAYVLALGSYSPLLARSLGFKLPIVPAKGYSITVPVGDHGGAPNISITDDEAKMVYSRLGDRLRAAGTAEFNGYDTSLNPKRWRVLLNKARDLFPDGGSYEHAEPWAGLRPLTPDSVPILGASPLKNLWLNTGHGTLGWTMACGSGRIVADLIGGRVPEIALDGLGLERF